jgi:PAS domain S-box-containing protein
VSRALETYCSISLVSEDGQRLDVLFNWDEDPHALGVIRERLRVAPINLNDPHPLVEALRSGRSLFIPQADMLRFVTSIPEPMRPKVEGLELKSVLHAPLRVRGQTLGLLTMIRHGNVAPFEHAERLLAENLADHAALAIHTAQLISLERAARGRAERELNERRKLEQQLKKTEEVLDAAPDAMVIVGLDGRIARVNGQTERLFGYTRDELLGRSVELLLPERFRAAHPGHRAGYFRNAQARTAGSGGVQLFARRKDGSEFPADINLAPIETPDGRQVTAAIRDVTRRKRAEEKFKVLVESAPDAMVVVDAQRHILLVNAQAVKLFGYEAQELVGRHVSMLIPERLRLGLTGLDAMSEYWCVRKDGSEVPVEISSSPLETEDGVVISSVIRDITEQRRQRQAILEANRAKSEFLAHMSHELRTPLNAIIGFAELLHRGRAGPLAADQKEYLGDILSSSRHLLQLINDVLDLAKVEAGRLELRPEPVDLNQLVAEVRDVLRGLAAEKRLTLEVSVDHALRDVKTDPQRLKQVLYNYLSNAIKFTPDGGRVSVRVAPQGEQLRLDVEDTGSGIAEGDLKRLFVEFQQLAAAGARAVPGSGLGLALTKRIVERMGGTVEVKSTVGQGSTFSAVLPRALAEEGRRGG